MITLFYLRVEAYRIFDAAVVLVMYVPKMNRLDTYYNAIT